MGIESLRGFAFMGGDWVIYLLILASVSAVAVIIERAIVYRRQSMALDALADGLIARLKNGGAAAAAASLDRGSVFSRLAQDLLRASPDEGGDEDRLQGLLALEKRYLDRRLTILATLGNNAPFLGLLGTVLGIIKAFHDLAQSAEAQPQIIMEGLSQALIATAAGIFVALPCVAAYNYFRKRSRDMLVDAERLGRRLIAVMRKTSPQAAEGAASNA
jgi:biopolymer transport protein ExbB/TolQ